MISYGFVLYIIFNANIKQLSQLNRKTVGVYIHIKLWIERSKTAFRICICSHCDSRR